MHTWPTGRGLALLVLCMGAVCVSANVEIIPFLPEHRQAVINLLISSFFIEEPINARLQFDIPHEPLAWVDFIVDGSLRDQCSFVAVDTSNAHPALIGVILNGIVNRTHADPVPAIESEKLNLIFSLFDQITAGYDLFERFNTDRLFHFDILNVDGTIRRQNVSGRLIEASEARARQLGIKGAFVVCSGLYSRKAFERRQYQVLNELLYATHEDKRLHNMGEHDRCTLLEKRL